MDVILSVAAGFLVLVVLAWPVRNRKADRQARLDRLDSALVKRILLELHATAESFPDTPPGLSIRQLQATLVRTQQFELLQLRPGKQYERLRDELKFLVREDLVEIYFEDEDQWDTTYVSKAPVA